MTEEAQGGGGQTRTAGGKTGRVFQNNTVESQQSVVQDTVRPDSEMHMLVGGPYTDASGETHRYGHTAIRVKTPEYDLTYDFGRYGRVTGDMGAEGEGILRVWSSFTPYINGEKATGRVTTGFEYNIHRHQADKIKAYYDGLIGSARPRPEMVRGRDAILQVYQLGSNYHALGYNCTTLSLDGAKAALPSYENRSQSFIKPGDVLNWMETTAMRTVGGGTPTRLFLPANLQKFLESNPPVRVNGTTVYRR